MGWLKFRNNGFTLIEILVAISIVAVLTAIVTATYGTIQKKNRDNVRMTDLNNIKLVLYLYKRDKGTFIPWTNPNDGTSTQTTWQAYVTDPTLGVTGAASNSLKNVFLPKYFTKFPTDTTYTTSGDNYYLNITPSTFVLSARLESSPTGTLNCIPQGALRNYCVTQ